MHISAKTYELFTAWWNSILQTFTYYVETKSHAFLSLNDYRNFFKQTKLNFQLYLNHISLLTATAWLHSSVSTANLLGYYIGFPLLLELIDMTKISYGVVYPVCVVTDTCPKQTFWFTSVKASISMISPRCRSNRHVSFYLPSPSICLR